jgi:outer membrane cobalamin receptor
LEEKFVQQVGVSPAEINQNDRRSPWHIVMQPGRKGSRLLMLACFATLFVEGHELEEVEVTGRRINLVGEAVSASQGMVGQQEIRIRPLLRTGEVLELVPGMVVTQHSGTGKANQYFLRGFNLDHGTDFATWVDGMPVNMRTHGHGQGYTDLNFVIPETIASLEYNKGSHYSDRGDFSSVGSAEMITAEGFDRGRLQASIGQDNYLRLLAMGSKMQVRASCYMPWRRIVMTVHGRILRRM